MRGFVGLVALALAHVARSEVFVSDFAALQNAIADGAVIRITSSFDWTDELVIGSGVNVTITNDEGVDQPILDRKEGGRFFTVEAGGTLVVRGLTFQNGRVVSRCLSDVCESIRAAAAHLTRRLSPLLRPARQRSRFAAAGRTSPAPARTA